MLARNYRRCSTLQNATGAFVGKVPAIGFHSVVGLRRVPPMSRRYPVEGAPGPSLLGTGVLGGPGFHPGAQSSQRRDRASGSC